MKRIIKLALLAIAVLTISAPFAGATSLYLNDDKGNWIWINDGDGWDRNPLPGVITYIGDLNGSAYWTINVTTGITKPAVGSATEPYLDLASVNVTTSGPSTLTIKFGDISFGPLLAASSFQSMIGGTTDGSVTYETWMDPVNGLWAQNTLLTTGTYGPGAFSDTKVSGEVLPQTAYSLSQYVYITHTGAGETSFDASLTVPEPSCLLLLGTGLGLTGLAVWRKRK